MNNKKKLMLLSLSALLGGVSAGVVVSRFSRINANADGCSDGNHNGNHYLATPATCTQVGNAEFWACCECGEAFLSNPGGTWVDQGAFSGVLPTDHVAYLAETDHDGKYHVKSFEAGSATVQLYCDGCGTYIGSEKTVAGPSAFGKTVGANYASVSDVLGITFSETYPFAWNEEKGAFASGNKGVNSSVSQMLLEAKGSFTLEFDIQDSSELNWDYITLAVNDDSLVSNVKLDGSETTIAAITLKGSSVKKHVSVDVTAGAIITIKFSKDSSGASGDDRGYVSNITLNSPEFAAQAEEVAVTLVTNGGVELDPVVALKGTSTELPDATRTGFYFMGWYDDAAFEVPHNSAAALNNDVKVYAKWLDESSAHVLYGKHTGWYMAAGQSSSGYATSDVYLEVAPTGAFTLSQYSSTKITGTLGAADANGVITASNGQKFYYDAASGLIATIFTNGSSRYAMIFAKGSTSAQSSTSLSGTYFTDVDKNYSKLVRVYNNGQYVTTFFDLINNEVAIGVDVEVVVGDAYSTPSSLASAAFIANIKKGSTVLTTVGYVGSTSSLGVLSAELTGIYNGTGGSTLSIAHDGTKTYARYSGHSSPKQNLTVSGIDGNVLSIVSSTSYNYTATIDKEAKTFSIVANVYTATFNWNGHMPEGAATSKSIVQGAWFYASDCPSVSGNTIVEGSDTYKFDGWYVDAEFSAKVSSSKLTGDVEYYAKWILLEDVTLSFNAQGGSECADQTVQAGNSYTGTLPTTERAGYKFLGWFYDEAGESAFNASATISGAFTLYAKWIAIPAWASISADSPAATVEGAITTVEGSTTADFSTYYARIHFAAGTYQYVGNTPTYAAGSSGVSSQYYQRFAILNADGTNATGTTAYANRDSKGTFTIAEGDYYFAINGTGNVPGSTTGQKDGSAITNFKVQFALVENNSVETAGTYTLGTTLAPTFPLASYDKYYKVHLEQGKSYEFRLQAASQYAQVYISSDGSSSASKCFKFGTSSTSYIMTYAGDTTDKVVTAEFDMETGDYYIVTSYTSEFSITELSAGTALPCDGKWEVEDLYVDFEIGDRKLLLSDMMNSIQDEELALVSSTDTSWTFHGSGVSEYDVVIEKDGDNFILTYYAIDGVDQVEAYGETSFPLVESYT